MLLIYVAYRSRSGLADPPMSELRIRVGTQDANFSRIRRIRNTEKNQALYCTVRCSGNVSEIQGEPARIKRN
jgi:hypothetical protein